MKDIKAIVIAFISIYFKTYNMYMELGYDVSIVVILSNCLPFFVFPIFHLD